MGVIVVGGKAIKLGSGNVLSVAPPDPEIYVTPTEILNVSYLGATCPVNVCGNVNNPTTVADACTWLVTTSPVTPSASPGTVNNIQICENIGTSCRCGVVCYIPSLGGAVKCVTVCQSTGTTDITLCSQLYTNVSGDGENLIQRVCGLVSNSTTVSTACSWIHATTPVSPAASPGTFHYICVDANTVCACRCGTICYIPIAGTMKTVTICQKKCTTWKCVDFCTYCELGAEGYYYDNKFVCMVYNPARVVGDCFCLTLCGELYVKFDTYGCACMKVVCNSTEVYCCAINYNSGYAHLCHEMGVDYNDSVCIELYAEDQCSCAQNHAITYISTIDACTGSASCFCNGSTCQIVCAFTA